mgnify:FL=1
MRRHLHPSTRLILSAILVIDILVFFAYYALSQQQAIHSQEKTHETYTNATYGVTFQYPSKYTLSETKITDSTLGTGRMITLLEKGVTIPQAGEGPTAITLAIYENKLATLADEHPLDTWVRATPESNFKLATQTIPNKLTIAGNEARAYAWDGLYQGISYVTHNNDTVLMFSVTYNGQGDTEKREDILSILKTLKLSRGTASVTTSFTGTYECLPHKDKDGIHTMECAFGIATDDGVHYAIDLQDVPEYMNTSMGSRIQVSGIYVPLEAISSTRWSTYDIKGIVRVSSFRKL